MLWDALQAFLPCIMQSMPPIAAQLEQFRTETLGKYLPAEKKEAAEASYMDSLIGLDNIQLPELPVVNSRAGLYIYLSAAVSFRDLLGLGAVPC
jgi:mediator of RNA polymerase II transcription subunit 5